MHIHIHIHIHAHIHMHIHIHTHVDIFCADSDMFACASMTGMPTGRFLFVSSKNCFI
jgi:hypothetical protein